MPQAETPAVKDPEEKRSEGSVRGFKVFLKSVPWWNTANTFLAVLALIVAGVSVYYYREQAQAAREANARASGRIRARMALLGSVPDSETLPQEKRKFVFGTNYTTASFDSPEQLEELRPRIVLKNVGEEPIEAIRISIRSDRVYGAKDPLRIVMNGARRGPFSKDSYFKEDFVLDQKLMPTEVAIVPLFRGILDQMLEAQQGADRDEERFGEFVVRPSAKMVGGSSFDGIEDDALLTIRFLWTPKGFDEKKCKSMIERPQLSVDVRKTGPEK